MSDIDLIAYIDPELKGSLILRRYLDFPKFVDFLRTGELFLGQASCFDDPLEGTFPESFAENLGVCHRHTS